MPLGSRIASPGSCGSGSSSATLTGVAAHKYAESYAEGRARGLPYKCLVMTDDADATLAYMRDSMPEGLATLIRGTPPFFVEVLHPDVNKGNGLVQMCKALGIPIEQVVAFGQEPHIAPWHLFMHARGLGLGGAWRVEAHHPPR